MDVLKKCAFMSNVCLIVEYEYSTEVELNAPITPRKACISANANHPVYRENIDTCRHYA